MSLSTRRDIVADRRLVWLDYFPFVGENLTGATYFLQVRQYPDLPGTPNASLTTVTTDAEGVRLMYSGTDTIANHITAGRLGTEIYQERNPTTGLNYASSDSVVMSLLRAIIGQPTMAAMPPAPEIGSDLNLSYDLLVQRSTSYAVKEYYGTFTVRGTVYQ